MTRRRLDAGLTMVEIMVSVLLVGIAAAFVFSIQVRTSQALRDQSAVSEVQQTLRAATDLIVSDLRQAGYLARSIKINNGGGTSTVTGLAITNSSTAVDDLRLQYADTSVSAHVVSGSARSAASTPVDDSSGFKEGDVILAVYTEPGHVLYGQGCAMMVTSVGGGTLGHAVTSGNPWNSGTNDQCSAFDAVWGTYPYMVIARAALRKYRVAPDDPRGILQVSPSGGVRADDWVDIAVGVVDMQFAMRVYEPDDTLLDDDGDLDTTRDWYSGELMESILDADPDNQLLSVSVTLVAKTTKNVNTTILDKTPDLFEGSDKDHNRVGDVEGTELPVTDKSSMYFGDVIFRTYTTQVDMRNMGIGF